MRAELRGDMENIYIVLAIFLSYIFAKIECSRRDMNVKFLPVLISILGVSTGSMVWIIEFNFILMLALSLFFTLVLVLRFDGVNW